MSYQTAPPRINEGGLYTAGRGRQAFSRKKGEKVLSSCAAGFFGGVWGEHAAQFEEFVGGEGS